MRALRILLTGGGTGGHIYPALTLAEAIRAQRPDVEFLYVGRKTGLEAEVLRQTEMAYAAIDSGGIAGLGAAARITGTWRALRGVFQAQRIIRRWRPRVAVGCGGYVSGPVLLGARLAGVPAVVLEADINPGLASRIAARWAAAVFVSHEAARPYFPPHTPVYALGMPVRQAVLAVSREAGRGAFGFGPEDQVVLIVGGSGGAKAIHAAAVAAARHFLGLPAVQVLHVSGQRYYEPVRQDYAAAGIDLDKPGRLRLVPYLHNMPEALAAADVAVTRAGMTTLAELTARGVPAVIIPSPNVARNHQEYNARVLAEAGAALLLPEAELTGESLATAVCGLLGDAAARSAMADAARALGRPEAAAAIAAQILGLAAKGRS